MEQINFKDWRLVASIVDTDIFRIEIEALDGSDIIEMGGPGVEREGEEYTLHLTTQKQEETQHQRPRRPGIGNGHDLEDEDAGAAWPADEDESIYLRGWEVDALVDEDGQLTVTVARGEGAEIFEVEPLETGVSLSPRIVVRLAAEETGDDEDKDDDDDEDDMHDEFEEMDPLDRLDEDYRDDIDNEDDDLEDGDGFDGEDVY